MPRGACGALLAVLATATGAAAAWGAAQVLDPGGPAFALVASWLLMAVLLVVVLAARPRLRSRWFRVGHRQARALQRTGAGAYGRVLVAVGWEAVMARARPFDGTRASLAAAEHATRQAELAHLLGGAVTAAVALLAAARGAWGTALWWALALVLLHAWPVASQRLVRHRLQRLADRLAARRP